MDLTERLTRKLKLRDLLLFESVVRSQSMARAAAQLHLTQPAVSKTVAELEKTLGVKLLERSRRGIEPTPQGRALLRGGMVIFDDLRQSVNEIEFLKDEAKGEVWLAAPDSMAGGVLPLTIERLAQAYPRISVHLVSTPVGALESRSLQYRPLRDREVDLVLGPIIGPLMDEALVAEQLFEDLPIVVAGARSPWARRRKIALEELLEEPWCMPPGDSPVGARFFAAFRACGVEPPERLVVGGSTHLFKSLLATQRYIAILPSSVVLANIDRLPLKRLPVHLPLPGVLIGLVTLKNRSLNPAARQFIAAARAVAERLIQAARGVSKPAP
ncbi:MAG TPA: LysR family transcriptional regulator [Stellaceae bacterium]|jgi:DNA-binding transcriptional LysR family regulator|nr:LysR family transcriptional regulator [Stellaceae bacterium]